MKEFKDKIQEILSTPTPPEDKTMVERLAETIWMTNRPEMAPDFNELDFLDQGRVRMLARAFLQAMREPTEEMITAGYQTYNQDLDPDPAIRTWKAMIDAALKED